MSDEKVLPFIEHLVELRRRLIVIVIAVVIGMGVAWNFSTDKRVVLKKPSYYLPDLLISLSC